MRYYGKAAKHSHRIGKGVLEKKDEIEYNKEHHDRGVLVRKVMVNFI